MKKTNRFIKGHHQNRLIIAFAFILALFSTPSTAGDGPTLSGEIKKGIIAEGSCAIIGMSAEQSRLTALKRARAAAIEEAAGIAVSAGTLVTNFAVSADFIKTYTRGFIIKEQVTWLPLSQYQQDTATAPIPEYRVKITADIYIPKKTEPLGLQVRLNNTVFRAGEKAQVSCVAQREAKVAIFNITADDHVSLLFPNLHEWNNRIPPGGKLIFPAKDSGVELEMHTLPGHSRDGEALLLIGWDIKHDLPLLTMFPPGEYLPLSAFFRRLAEIGDKCEEVILPYEVVSP